MKKKNVKKMMSKVTLGALACLMAFTFAGCGQEEKEAEEKSLGERIEDEVLPDHEEAKQQVEDAIVGGLHDALEEGL